MTTKSCRWTRSLFSLALLAAFISSGTLLEGKGGKPKPPPPPPTPDVSYSIQFLVLPGGNESGALGMNNQGDIVGYSTANGGNGGRGFLYEASTGTLIDLTDLFNELQPEGDWLIISGTDINDSGQLVCYGLRHVSSADEEWVGVRYTPGSIDGNGDEILPLITVLDSLDGGWTVPDSINGIGEVVGDSDTASGSQRGIIWTEQNGTREIISPFPTSNALGINQFGEVSGNVRSDETSIFRHAYRWSEVSGFEDLGFINGVREKGSTRLHSTGDDINDLGQVVGRSHANSRGTQTHAYRFTDGVGMVDLGTLGGEHSRAYAINNFGETVGEAQNSDNAYRAFLFTNETGMFNLEDVIIEPPASLRFGMKPLDINDIGHICGFAYVDNGAVESRAFLLTPIAP